MKKLLVSLMLIIYSAVNSQNITSLDPSQVYNTANIVNNTTNPTNTTGTWQNIGLWNQELPCWGPGGPLYCGPQPYFNNGSFNFSYGITDVYQTANVANSLPNSGTGLRVNGYNFSFLAKNGNGWDGGNLDYLYAYVHFTDKNNGVVYYKSYDLNYKFDWTTFNYSENFKTPYASKDLNNVTYGFVGGDSNFWAGPYGPEVINISFSLKYSVDPCYVNVLSSPSCPGYLDMLAKLTTPTAVDTSTPVTFTSTSPTSTTTITVEPSTVIATSTTSVGQPAVIAPVISAPAPSTTTSNATTSTATTQSTKETTINNSLALSIISKNQERDNAALSVAQTAVSQASQAAQQSQQEAASVATNAVTNSQSANIVFIGQQQSSGNGIRVNNTSNNSIYSLSSPSNTTNTSVISALSPQLQTAVFTTPSTMATIVEQPQQSQTALVPNNNTTTSTIQNYAMVPPNFLTDRTNPLTEIVEGRQIIQTNNTTVTTGSVINKNANDNEAAGSVNIEKMAIAPTGYGNYLNFALKDATFYAPKEVYKNQKNVDNAKLLRQLTNDSKHQEMVDQQYRR